MAKKKKTGSAEDLIDSLLDNPSDEAQSRSKPTPPELPKLSSKKEDDEFDHSIVFDLDFDKAEPSRPLVLVTDKNEKPQKVEKQKAKDNEATVVMSKPAFAKPSPSEIRRAETVVQKDASVEVSVDLPKLESPAPAADKTVRLPASEAISISQKSSRVESGFGDYRPTSAPTNFGPGMPATPTDLLLKQTEGLRIAQNRIHELEAELDRLRHESEKLASAGETLRRRTDELLGKSENLENLLLETKHTSEEEKKIMRAQVTAKERENMDLRSKLEEAETRLEGNFKKIRVRERELEHRLEIVKIEGQTLVSQKDDMIMRLKREIDQMKFEIENSKVKSQELYNQYKEKQETARRVVRALRIALTILEGDEDPGLKKAE